MEVYINHKNIKVCSNVLLDGTVFDYFHYFIHTMIIGTPVKEWHNNINIFTDRKCISMSHFHSGCIRHRWASTSTDENKGEVLGYITFS